MKYVKLVLKYLLAVFFVVAGVMHFVNPDFYLTIMPPYVPFHEFFVYLSGVTEVVAGVLLAVPATSRWGAWFIVAHLVVFFTVHIHMAVNAEQFADYGAPAALNVRILIQFILIAWAFWFTRPNPVVASA